MNDLYFLQQSFENFNKATAGLQASYTQLEKRFAAIQEELEVKNGQLRQMVAANEEMKNYLSNILESLTNGVVVTDRDGNIQTVNRCAEIFAERTAGKIKGKHIQVLFKDISPEAWENILSSNYFKKETGQRINLHGRALQIFGSTLHARQGENPGIIFIMRDITRIEKLEAMAKRKEKFASMGEMAANIAHEMRNPLGSIELFASLLMKEITDEKGRDKAAKIVAAVKNMDNKISNLLLFTKTTNPRAERLDVQALLKETIMFVEPLAPQGSISFSCNFHEGDALVTGDGEMLKQVFLNIILNAFQAMPEGGHLHMETRLSDTRQAVPYVNPFLEISFSDDGIGIPEENLSKIFDPFFSTREGTSGLGLAIVHNIVDQHKGVIHVERGRLQGTTFTVMLPLWKRDEEHSTSTDIDNSVNTLTERAM